MYTTRGLLIENEKQITRNPRLEKWQYRQTKLYGLKFDNAALVDRKYFTLIQHSDFSRNIVRKITKNKLDKY
jgi:hypothetical protein